jgi:hypothetical protein
MARLEIPQKEFRVLRGLAELKDSEFDALVGAFKDIEPQVKALDFVPLLQKDVPSIDPSALRLFVNTISSLARIMEGKQVSAERVAGDVKETIDFEKPRSFEESKDEKVLSDKTERLRGRLIRLLTVGPFISVVFKAGNVFTDQDRSFGHAKILSDIRPIFGAGPDEVKAGMIVHFLNIHYHQDREHKEFFVALSTADIEDLKAVLDRALKKSETLKGLMPKMGIRVLEER